MVIPHYIVEDECKKKENDSKKRKEKGAGQRRQTRQPVDIHIMVKNAVQQHPANRDNQDAEKKFGVAKNTGAERHIFDAHFTVQEKQCPSQHCHQEIGNTVNECIKLAFSSQQGCCWLLVLGCWFLVEKSFSLASHFLTPSPLEMHQPNIVQHHCSIVLGVFPLFVAWQTYAE